MESISVLVISPRAGFFKTLRSTLAEETSLSLHQIPDLGISLPKELAEREWVGVLDLEGIKSPLPELIEAAGEQFPGKYFVLVDAEFPADAPDLPEGLYLVLQ